MTQSEDIESENNQAFFLKYFVDEPENIYTIIKCETTF